MIDVENKVFNTIYEAVHALYPDAYIVSDELNVPDNFPCVSVVETDNSTLARTQDDDLVEHHANVTYTVNVYTNNVEAKKSTAKQILNVVDEEMQKMKFTRRMKSPTPNADSTIYRITARYMAIVADAVVDNDVKTHQMYRP